MAEPTTYTQGYIPDDFHDIFEKNSFAHVATCDNDGWVHVNPVWVDHEDGEYVLINTKRGRVKDRNMRANPRVAVSVSDPDNPYRYVSVRGHATLTTEGAADHIDKLASAYLDADRYPHHDEEDEPRVIVRIRAEHVITRERSADR